jgi:ferrous iron transport protein B
VDLPGIHDLDGHSADEAVVKDFLHQIPPDLVLVIVNASQIAAQLRLVLQLLALGLPTVLALNMSDEARRLGVVIDAPALAEGLGIPVVAISAERNEGIGDLLDRLARLQVPPPEFPEAELESRLEILVDKCVQQPEQLVPWHTRNLDR